MNAAERTALSGALKDAGFINDEWLDLPALAHATRHAKEVRPGKVIGCDDGVAEIRALKPGWFRAPDPPAALDWSTLSDEEFSAKRAELTRPRQSSTDESLALPKVDVVDCDAEEFASVRRVIRGEGDARDRFLFDRVAQRQKVGA